MSDTTLKEWTQTGLAFVVVIGGGWLIYLNGISNETTLAITGIIGVVLGFYFGSASTTTVTRAATSAAVEAVSRSMEARGIQMTAPYPEK